MIQKAYQNLFKMGSLELYFTISQFLGLVKSSRNTIIIIMHNAWVFSLQWKIMINVLNRILKKVRVICVPFKVFYIYYSERNLIIELYYDMAFPLTYSIFACSPFDVKVNVGRHHQPWQLSSLPMLLKVTSTLHLANPDSQ